MLRSFLVFISIFILTFVSTAQSFGIRAGLNYTKFSGPLEQGVQEKFSISNGFHFGINYEYNFADRMALRTELVYTQVGSKYNYEGDSYYKVPFGSGFSYQNGVSNINMKISNAYLTIPITFQYKIFKKIELNTGIYASLMISPRGNGTIYFEQSKDSLFFKQSLIHNYKSDVAKGASSSNSLQSPTRDPDGPAIWADKTYVRLHRDAGAYYNYLGQEKVGNLYKPIDFGLTGGLSYFINKGFYASIRYDFGLLDITNNDMDYLRKDFNRTTGRGILSNHFDRNVGFQLSMGFRF